MIAHQLYQEHDIRCQVVENDFLETHETPVQGVYPNIGYGSHQILKEKAIHLKFAQLL